MSEAHQHLTPRERLLPCIAALAGIFVFALSANMLPATQKAVASDFGVTVPRLMLAFSVQFTAFFLTTIVGGVLADYFGKKALFVLAAVATVAGSVIWGIAPQLWIAYLGSVLLGMGGGILESMSSALLSDLFPQRRKFFLNLSQVLYCAGAIGGPFIVGWLMPQGVIWRAFFHGVGLLGVVLLLLFAFSRIPPPEAHERIDPTQFKRIVRRASFLIPCIVLFCYVLTETGVVSFINYYLYTYQGAPENWAIYGISIFWGTVALGRVICAFLPEELSYEYVVAALCGLSALSLLAQAWITGWVGATIGFALTGLLFAGSWPLIVGLTATRNPRHSGTVIGLTVAVGSLGCVAAPPFMEWLFTVLQPAWVFPIAALPLALSVILLLVMARFRQPTDGG